MFDMNIQITREVTRTRQARYDELDPQNRTPYFR